MADVKESFLRDYVEVLKGRYGLPDLYAYRSSTAPGLGVHVGPDQPQRRF